MFLMFLIWIGFSALVAYAAGKKGKSAGTWFTGALLFSPFIMGLAILFADVSGVKKCPKCAEDVKNEAIKCKHCGHDFAIAESVPSTNESNLERVMRAKYLEDENARKKSQAE